MQKADCAKNSRKAARLTIFPLFRPFTPEGDPLGTQFAALPCALPLHLVVHEGQFWANTEQMGYVIDALTSGPPARVIAANGVGLLPLREEQVVNLVAEGIGNREIANQLGIMENTVKKSLLRIYDKLGVSNRVELVLYALTHRGSGPTELAGPARPKHAGPPAVQCLDPDQVGILGENCGCIHEN